MGGTVYRSDDSILHDEFHIPRNTAVPGYGGVDYQQHRSLLQQLTGLKTITIMSGDRNLPNLDIIGVEEEEEVVQEIRLRVEYNKQMKHIHEITNRM